MWIRRLDTTQVPHPAVVAGLQFEASETQLPDGKIVGDNVQRWQFARWFVRHRSRLRGKMLDRQPAQPHGQPAVACTIPINVAGGLSRIQPDFPLPLAGRRLQIDVVPVHPANQKISRLQADRVEHKGRRRLPLCIPRGRIKHFLPRVKIQRLCRHGQGNPFFRKLQRSTDRDGAFFGHEPFGRSPTNHLHRHDRAQGRA